MIWSFEITKFNVMDNFVLKTIDIAIKQQTRCFIWRGTEIKG